MTITAKVKGGSKGGILLLPSASRGAPPAHTICTHSQNQTEQKRRKRGGKDEAGGESGAKNAIYFAFLARGVHTTRAAPDSPPARPHARFLPVAFASFSPFTNERKRTELLRLIGTSTQDDLQDGAEGDVSCAFHCRRSASCCCLDKSMMVFSLSLWSRSIST